MWPEQVPQMMGKECLLASKYRIRRTRLYPSPGALSDWTAYIIKNLPKEFKSHAPYTALTLHHSYKQNRSFQECSWSLHVQAIGRMLLLESCLEQRYQKGGSHISADLDFGGDALVELDGRLVVNRQVQVPDQQHHQSNCQRQRNSSAQRLQWGTHTATSALPPTIFTASQQ